MKYSLVSSTLWIFTILAFCLIIGISIFTDGMFFDGLAYAAVAENLANGNGSIWHLTYTQTLHTAYYEQPPFTFVLQSLFFRVLGHGRFVERIYCFLLAALMAITIRRIWIDSTESGRANSWYPVLLWICVPLVSWTYQNNLEEVTMGWFDALAVFFLIRDCSRNKVLFIFCGGVFTFLASFCKGLQGLFPIIIPVLYGFVFRRNLQGSALKQLLAVIAFPVLMYSIFYFWPDAHNFYEHYIDRRLLGTFHGIQNSTSSHFHLLSKLLLELLVPVWIVIVFKFIFRIDKKSILSPEKKALLLFFIGLSASLPLLVTLEQRAFYLTTSMPYFVLAIALWSQNIPVLINEKITARLLKNKMVNRILIVAIVATVFSYAFILHIPKRDHDLIHDVNLIGKTISPGTLISIPGSMAAKWNYHAYFMRYDQISLDEKAIHPFFLSEQNQTIPTDSCFQKVNLPLKKLLLYHCDESMK